MIIQAIQKRRSIRQFKQSPIPTDIIQEVLKAAQFAPASRGNKAMHYIIVTDQETKKLIYQATVNKQGFILEAPTLIIPTTDPEQTKQPVQDLSLASENILLQATELGLGSVWKNFRLAVADEVKKITGIPSEYVVINAIAVGFPAESIEPHADTDFEQSRIHQEKW
ncbi:MAG: nitroreductase family protein [Patescibacteria group bacterium]|jgi:nitroreductase